MDRKELLRRIIMDNEDTGEIPAIKDTQRSQQALQLGIDIGRVIANTEYSNTPNDIREASQKITDILGISIAISEDPSFLLGLGYGIADRRNTPIDDAILEISGNNEL
jgi:hypothetical protein